MSFPKNGQSYQPKTQISRKYLDEFSSLEIPGYVHKGLHCVRGEGTLVKSLGENSLREIGHLVNVYFQVVK